jgi:hypothetical protein
VELAIQAQEKNCIVREEARLDSGNMNEHYRFWWGVSAGP